MTRFVDVKLVQLRLWQILSPEDAAVNEPGQDRAQLIFRVRARGNTEDIIELLERSLLGFGKPQEDHDEGDDVQTCIEAKGALWCKAAEHIGKGQSQYRGPEAIGRHGPRHSHLTVRQRENFCRVGIWTWSHARGVKSVEEVDEEGDTAEPRTGTVRDPKADAGGEE